MAIDHHGLEFRIDYLLPEHDRVAVAGIDSSLVRAGLDQQGSQPFGAAAHVFLMLFLGADRGNPQ